MSISVTNWLTHMLVYFHVEVSYHKSGVNSRVLVNCKLCCNRIMQTVTVHIQAVTGKPSKLRLSSQVLYWVDQFQRFFLYFDVIAICSSLSRSVLQFMCMIWPISVENAVKYQTALLFLVAPLISQNFKLILPIPVCCVANLHRNSTLLLYVGSLACYY